MRLRTLLLTGALLPLGIWGREIGDWLVRLLPASERTMEYKGGGCTDPNGRLIPCPPEPRQTVEGGGCTDPNGRPVPCGG